MAECPQALVLQCFFRAAALNLRGESSPPKFRCRDAANWTLGSSDDGHHWVGVRKAENGTTIRKLVDNCGSEHQKIWYTVFEVNFGLTSTGRAVWKGGQTRAACRSCRINFGDFLLLCAHFQVDFMGRDFNTFSYRYFRTGNQCRLQLLCKTPPWPSCSGDLMREAMLSTGTPIRITRSTSSGATSTWPTLMSTSRSIA